MNIVNCYTLKFKSGYESSGHFSN